MGSIDFCDGCGKIEDDLLTYKLDYEIDEEWFTFKQFELCLNCLKVMSNKSLMWFTKRIEKMEDKKK